MRGATIERAAAAREAAVPVSGRRADAVAVFETEVESAARQHRERVVPGAHHIILGPGLTIAISRRIHQHEQTL